MNPFLGRWVGPDEYTAEVEYTVREEAGGLVVEAVDPGDGESAEISAVRLSGHSLSFVALWPSTGRLARCCFERVSQDEIRLTFTFTDHARLVRKSGAPAPAAPGSPGVNP